MIKNRVKTAKGKKKSSVNWLKRQINDPYVAQAKKDDYLSRAAYKLIEINDKFHLLDKGKIVVDLGAAPGSWSQVIAAKIINSKTNTNSSGKIYAIDKKPITDFKLSNLNNLINIQADCFDEETVIKHINEKVDLVLSDMSPEFCGDKVTDKIRALALCEQSLVITSRLLKNGGNFVTKIFHGSDDREFRANLKRYFKYMHYYKPKSSRKDSAETYIIALDFNI